MKMDNKRHNPLELSDRQVSAVLGALGFALVLLLSPNATNGQNSKNNCGHPPKMVSQPSFSDEGRAKWKGKAVSGKVALVISENGDVADARVLSASPREAAESLLGAVRRAKFASRPGCGELRTEVVFNLNR